MEADEIKHLRELLRLKDVRIKVLEDYIKTLEESLRRFDDSPHRVIYNKELSN
jgi:hypothetical protein